MPDSAETNLLVQEFGDRGSHGWDQLGGGEERWSQWASGFSFARPLQSFFVQFWQRRLLGSKLQLRADQTAAECDHKEKSHTHPAFQVTSVKSWGFFFSSSYICMDRLWKHLTLRARHSPQNSMFDSQWQCKAACVCCHILTGRVLTARLGLFMQRSFFLYCHWSVARSTVMNSRDPMSHLQVASFPSYYINEHMSHLFEACLVFISGHTTQGWSRNAQCAHE